jgi:hypothetical protein
LVVLSDRNLVRELFRKSFLGNDSRQQRVQGIFSSQGTWKEQTDLTLRRLNDSEFDKSFIEYVIQEEIDEFIQWMKSEEGKLVQLDRRFTHAVVNIVWKILSAKSYCYDDPTILRILDKEYRFNESLSRNPLLSCPPLAQLLPKLSGLNSAIELAEGVRDEYQEIISHLEDGNGTAYSSMNFIREYLQEDGRIPDADSILSADTRNFSKVTALANLLYGGSEPISATLCWAVFYISSFIDVQIRIQEELDRVVGKSRRPNLADRHKLSYMEATVLEVLRMTSIVPSGALHKTLSDVKLRNFNIPAGTWVVSNLHHGNHDPNKSQDSDVFLPERFLNEDGTLVEKFEHAEFPSGNCETEALDDPLARDEIFLFLSSIYQIFNTVRDENEAVDAEAGCVPKLGLTDQPPIFNVLLTFRV